MRFLIGFAICLLFAITVNAQETFREMSFKDAQAAAQKENKFILIDFYTTWCGPCKMLDKNTWRNEKVQGWLNEKAIALKVDAEKDTDLAKQYNIHAYPTIVLIKADGKEIDRLVGYREPEKFLAEANDALAGKDSIARAKALLTEDNKNNPQIRMRYADALAQKGRDEEALAEYLWCFDHGLEYEKAFVGVRLSFLLGKIQQLGAIYPPAIDALRERREGAEKDVLEGRADNIRVVDLARLNEILSEKRRTLDTFDKLKYAAGDKASMRAALIEHVIDQLIDAHRYADIIDNTKNAGTIVDQAIARFGETESFFKSRKDMEGKEQMIENFRRRALQESARYYEALLGVKRDVEAAQIAEKLIKFDNSGQTFVLLINAAIHAGQNGVARDLAKRGLNSLPEAEQPKVREASNSIGQ